MPLARPMQSTFTSGVVNPALKARVDIQHYYDGLSLGDNVDVKPEGGVLVRGGLRYITTAAELNARLIPFIFNKTTKYLLEFTNLQMRVFKDGVLQATEVTTLTTSQVDEMDFSQSYNSLFLFHEDVQPQLVFRGGDDVTWSIGAITFDNIPDFDFNDASSPTPTTHDIQITFAAPGLGTLWEEGEHYKLELNNYETPEIVYSDDTDANCRRIKEELLKLPPTGFRESSITVTHLGTTVYQIQFSDDSADAYEPMTGSAIDTLGLWITESTRTTEGVSRREPCISSTRGWPACGTLYEGRLWMGGLKSLPQHELSSVVNDLLNLKVGDGFDDEAIFQAFDTDQYNGIDFLHPGRHLQVFTDGGEFFHPARPITPAQSGRPRQTRYGSRGIKPVEIDGATLFVTKRGKTLREFLFAQLEESYNASSLSLLAAKQVLPEVIVAMDAISNADEDEASYVFCVTDDGNAGVLNTLRSQDIAAWSRYTTDGDLKRVAVLDDEVYFLVHRTIDGTEVAYIERIDATLRMDSAISGTQTASTTISGLDHLEGETVRVIANGFLLDSEVVSAGAITLAIEASSYQVGLDFNPDVRLMPLNVDLGDGPLIGRNKSVPELYVMVQETNGLTVGLLLDDEDEQTQVDEAWVVGAQLMDTVPATITGLRHFEMLGSTEGDAIIRVYQTDPLPFHVLGVLALIDIGDE